MSYCEYSKGEIICPECGSVIADSRRSQNDWADENGIDLYSKGRYEHMCCPECGGLFYLEVDANMEYSTYNETDMMFDNLGDKDEF